VKTIENQMEYIYYEKFSSDNFIIPGFVMDDQKFTNQYICGKKGVLSGISTLDLIFNTDESTYYYMKFNFFKQPKLSFDKITVVDGTSKQGTDNKISKSQEFKPFYISAMISFAPDGCTFRIVDVSRFEGKKPVKDPKARMYAVNPKGKLPDEVDPRESYLTYWKKSRNPKRAVLTLNDPARVTEKDKQRYEKSVVYLLTNDNPVMKEAVVRAWDKILKETEQRIGGPTKCEHLPYYDNPSTGTPEKFNEYCSNL
jgi:hypothetical protein